MIRKFLGLLVAAWIGAIGSFGPSFATPAKEAPWLPDAAAYRLTLFLGNLEPIPWGQVEAAWSDPYHNSEFPWGALAWLNAKSDIGAEPVLDAIARRDRQALFEAATQTIAHRIEEELDRALNADDPATAQKAVQTARELYRAFADGVAAADPDAARQEQREVSNAEIPVVEMEAAIFLGGHAPNPGLRPCSDAEEVGPRERREREASESVGVEGHPGDEGRQRGEHDERPHASTTSRAN